MVSLSIFVLRGTTPVIFPILSRAPAGSNSGDDHPVPELSLPQRSATARL
jgi:hypothetical protein